MNDEDLIKKLVEALKSEEAMSREELGDCND